MYRVGILGTENSHAMAFTQLLNSADSAYPDFKVTALYALEKKPSEDICAQYSGITIVDKPEDMMDLVDCVMITSRHGKYHLPFSIQFVKAGKPVFIDKPFTISNDDARMLVDAAKAAGVPLTGGSGCKYSDELLEYKSEIESGKIGKVASAVMTFAAELDSEYGGFYFYGAHLVEMMLTVYGCNVKSISAFVKNGHLTAIARYDELDVVLSFAKSYTAIAYGNNGYIVKNITTNNIYQYEMDHFTEMVRTGKSPIDPEQLVKSVEILNAIEKSFTSNCSVEL